MRRKSLWRTLLLIAFLGVLYFDLVVRSRNYEVAIYVTLFYLWPLGIAWIVMGWPRASLINRLLSVLLLYFLVDYSFARIYYNIYCAEPSTFVFQKDVALAGDNQVALLRKATKTEIKRQIAQKELDLSHLQKLRHLLNGIENLSDILNISWSPSAFEDRVEFHATFPDLQVYGDNRLSGFGYFASLVIKSPKGISKFYYTPIYASDYPPKDDLKDKSISRIEKLITDTQSETDSLRNQSVSLSVGVPTWTMLDFVYFSTMTISTLGYGDILPNHRIVRALVVAEVFIGLLILVVAVNIVVVYWKRTK